MTDRTADHGFTLLEALIALAILAITAVSLLQATEANVGRAIALEARAGATWVAQNRLAELSLGLAVPEGPVLMLGRDYEVETTTTPTADPALSRVDIVVRQADGAAGSQLTGFVWAGGGL